MPSRHAPAVRRAFTIVAVVEALTWTGLLVGMFLKYVTETTEAGVWLFGRLHGAAFLVYCVTALVAARVLRWSWLVTLLALAASVPPLTTLLFEVVARRRGLLRERSTAAVADDREPVTAGG
jgi:integral membrane protein